MLHAHLTRMHTVYKAAGHTSIIIRRGLCVRVDKYHGPCLFFQRYNSLAQRFTPGLILNFQWMVVDVTRLEIGKAYLTSAAFKGGYPYPDG